jgi:hypothetical protein
LTYRLTDEGKEAKAKLRAEQMKLQHAMRTLPLSMPSPSVR